MGQTQTDLPLPSEVFAHRFRELRKARGRTDDQ
jgi:hypothetical protein